MRADLTGYRAAAITSPVQRSLILKTFPGFSALAGSELAVLAAVTRERFFARGEVMLEPERPVTAMYLVVEGRVQSYLSGQPSQIFGPRSAVGGLAALTRDPRGAHAVALDDVVALEMDPEDMVDVFEDHFEITIGVIGALARGLRELQMKLGGGAAIDGREFPDFDTGHRLNLVDKMFCLTRSTSFADSSIEAVAELAEGADEIRAIAGEPLWRHGDPADFSLMIVSGEVEATPPDDAAFRFGSGWVVGGLDSLGGLPRWYDLAVGSDLVALRLRRAILFDVLEDHPDMALELLRGLARGTSRALARAHRQSDDRR
jgi:CRP-like cAMP-binding protein